MQIAQDMVVSLIYTLQADNAEGEILQTATQENPLTFIYGHGQLLPAFEENILGLEPGSSYAFSLSYDAAYGPVDPDSIFDVDINIFRQSPEGEQMRFI
ncbi:MAG TPA: peptidylprolyl isomerase, partial [Bacteroidales bacterium]|nr:peptidylprolyl isomerase [Bacteroidales bacterium]